LPILTTIAARHGKIILVRSIKVRGGAGLEEFCVRNYLVQGSQAQEEPGSLFWLPGWRQVIQVNKLGIGQLRLWEIYTIIY